MSISHRKEIRKLTFRAQALRRSESTHSTSREGIACAIRSTVKSQFTLYNFQFVHMEPVEILVDNVFQQKEKTNSGYKHNSKDSHGIFNLTFRMLQHTSSEVTVTKSDEI